jgi:hypothetical protein
VAETIAVRAKSRLLIEAPSSIVANTSSYYSSSVSVLAEKIFLQREVVMNWWMIAPGAKK